MPRWQKALTTVWSTLLVAPILWFALAWGGAECGEMDPCPTGGPMPYATEAVAAFVVIAMLHLAFLAMVWRGSASPAE